MKAIYTRTIPYVSRTQMVEVDRAMIEDYHIDLIQMMENAGRNLASLARFRFLKRDPRNKKVLILAGTGGNGGGALACARHLHNSGADVQIFVTKPVDQFSPVAAHQLEILTRMGLTITPGPPPPTTPRPDLVIDGIIGYSLNNAPHGSAAALIQWANDKEAPILALDTPSGLDVDDGTVHIPTICAQATMTLALPKIGLKVEAAQPQVGELYLADISIPPALYSTFGVAPGEIFARTEVVRLR